MTKARPIDRIVIQSVDGPRTVADTVETAQGLQARIVGLIGRQDLPTGTALIITSCKQVHTFFMRFPIDILFIDKESKVVGVAEGLKPYSISGYCRSATSAVELREGSIRSLGITVGDVLILEATP